MKIESLGLIGFGEVGSLFGAALSGRARVSTYDRLLDQEPASSAMRERAIARGVAVAESLGELLADCQVVISAVTASEALNVARDAAARLRKGTCYLDVNSASPRTKAACAERIDGAGGRYVEAAVMAPVAPYGLRVPMLLGGAHAAEFAPALAALGFEAKAASERLGAVSAIKMCRSVMVKGLEALTIECYIAARAYGVEGPVLASLAETFPAIDWERQGDYFFERVRRHGRRRAEEMREAAATVRDIGLDGCLAQATAQRQQWVADLADAGVFRRAGGPWQDTADAAIESMRNGNGMEDKDAK